MSSVPNNPKTSSVPIREYSRSGDPTYTQPLNNYNPQQKSVLKSHLTFKEIGLKDHPAEPHLDPTMSALRQRKAPPSEDPIPSTFRKLHSWDEIPEWQQDNCYILHGYVKETSSFIKCLESLTFLHNESVNIYTHLIPGVMYFSAMVYFLTHYVEIYDTTTWADNAAFSVFAFGAAAALTLSSCFHCFKCHSKAVAAFGNKLDYLGIIILIVTSMFSILYYSLIDMPGVRLFYWSLTLLLGSVCAVLSLREKFRTRDWRPYRAGMFVLFGLSGVFPILTGIQRLGVEEVARRSLLKWIIWEGVLYIFGAGLYAARVPERYLPGTYDLWGHSHQLFHVLVVIAACCHGIGLIGAYHYAHRNIIALLL